MLGRAAARHDGDADATGHGVGVVGVVAVWSSWPTVSVTMKGFDVGAADVLVEHPAVVVRIGDGLGRGA